MKEIERQEVVGQDSFLEYHHLIQAKNSMGWYLKNLYGV